MMRDFSRGYVCIIILAIIAALQFGCSNTNSKNNIVNDKNKNARVTASSSANKVTESSQGKSLDGDSGYELLKQNSYWEYRYYSPDNKNYIRSTIIPSDGYQYADRKIYLNGSKSLLAEQSLFEWDKEVSPSAIWLSDNKVLIKGEYVLDINSNTKDDIDLSTVLEKDGRVDDYRVNKNNNKIAYIINNDSIQKVYIYDMLSKKWEKIYEKKFVNTSDSPYLVSWDYKDNLYFDTWDFSLDEQNKIKEPRETIYQIYRYSLKNKRLEPFKSGFILGPSSPDYKYIILRNPDNNKKVLVDVDASKSNISFDGEGVSWSSDSESFAYIKDDTIEVFSLNKNDIVRNVRFKDDKGSSLYHLDYYKGNYFFFTSKDDSSEIKGSIYMVK